MSGKINVALIGLGDVACALVQGTENYKQNPNKTIGLLPEITQYSVNDINFVVGFDVNSNKVGKDMSEAVFAEPNCNMQFFRPEFLNAPILKGPVMDGLDSNIRKIIPISDDQKSVDVSKEMQDRNVDVAAILLPTGSHNAVKYYAIEALKAGVSVVNGMPSEVIKDPEIVNLAEECQLSLIGDDVKSQIGATIVHRSLANLFPMRGAILERTIQLDWGGCSDFCNLLTPMPDGKLRYEQGKRKSKTGIHN